jgi:Putative prokaryotic signal transducing protein
MSEERVLVYTTNKSFEAEMLRQFLSDNEIDAFIINKQDSSYHFGDVEIYVKRDDVIKSKLLIKKFEN